MINRRAILGAAALLPVAACAPPPEPAPTSAAPPPTTTAEVVADDGALAALESRYGARLGLYAVSTGTRRAIAHRADERFAFCSTFKAVAAAAVLHANPMSHLDTLVRYTEADLTKNGVITRQNLATGMTIGQLCDAAVRYSDGTAGNLLLRDIGGPDRLTAYARSLGDEVMRMDRVEPHITEATPGDPRDTTSPRAFAATFEKIVLGDALEPGKRAYLRDLLERNATESGAKRVRAGLPPNWRAADKTGTGDYATANDIAVVWPPEGAPLVLAVMTSKPDRDARYDQALLAEATAHVVTALA